MVDRVERGIAYFVEYIDDFHQLSKDQRKFIQEQIHDRMIEVVLDDGSEAEALFSDAEPAPLKRISLSNNPRAALEKANTELGLALSADEIQYLADNYSELQRDPTDVELMMFAQANSEHCLARPGTISPWSSKATDILHNCGLTVVDRVERGIAYFVEYIDDFHQLSKDQRKFIQEQIHDRMIEVVLDDGSEAEALFSDAEPAPLKRISLSNNPRAALEKANTELGLALSADEIQYLADNYSELQRDPTDVELMMFAQANSEHCRHKIFNADWIIDGKKQQKTLFGMIKNTYKHSPENVLSAYHDNASVVEGSQATRFFPNPSTHEYGYSEEPVHMLMKVETHNHPTAISPFPGAATGSGGEIRDEGATGNGSKPKVGLCGFSVSNLKIPGYPMPWEKDHGKPERIDSALNIMLEGPIGAAAFYYRGKFRTLPP